MRPSSAFERLLERGRAAHEAERGRVAGGVYRHACRRSWRYAADNYYTRELTGLTTAATAATTATGRSTANRDPPPDGGGLARSLGGVTLADAADAMRVLDASFRVVLVTEVHKKGWRRVLSPSSLFDASPTSGRENTQRRDCQATHRGTSP